MSTGDWLEDVNDSIRDDVAFTTLFGCLDIDVMAVLEGEMEMLEGIDDLLMLLLRRRFMVFACCDGIIAMIFSDLDLRRRRRRKTKNSAVGFFLVFLTLQSVPEKKRFFCVPRRSNAYYYSF